MSASVSNSTLTSAPGAAGRGGTTGDGTREDRSGRGRGTRNRNRNNNDRATRGSGAAGDTARPARTNAFKGATEGMNGHTFGCFDEQGDKRQYVKTVEALSQYANKRTSFRKTSHPCFSPKRQYQPSRSQGPHQRKVATRLTSSYSRNRSSSMRTAAPHSRETSQLSGR